MNPAPLADRGILRFLTCGSVDDGKSTLIGRLLFDAMTNRGVAEPIPAVDRHADQ